MAGSRSCRRCGKLRKELSEGVRGQALGKATGAVEVAGAYGCKGGVGEGCEAARSCWRTRIAGGMCGQRQSVRYDEAAAQSMLGVQKGSGG